MYRLRHELARRYNLQMLVHRSAEAKDPAVNPFDVPSNDFTRLTLTDALKQAIDKHGFYVAFGGGRRDEE